MGIILLGEIDRHVRLLSSPTYQPGQASAPKEAYVVVSLVASPYAGT